MHITKWKTPNSKGHTQYDPNFTIPWKRRTMETVQKDQGQLGVARCVNRQEHWGFMGSETTLYDTIVGHLYYYIQKNELHQKWARTSNRNFGW